MSTAISSGISYGNSSGPLRTLGTATTATDTFSRLFSRSSVKVTAHCALFLQNLLFGATTVFYKLYLPAFNPLTLCCIREVGAGTLLYVIAHSYSKIKKRKKKPPTEDASPSGDELRFGGCCAAPSSMGGSTMDSAAQYNRANDPQIGKWLWANILVAGFCLWFGQVMNVAGVKVYGEDSAVIAAALQPVQPILTLFFTSIIFSMEELSVFKVLGILLGVAGAIFMLMAENYEKAKETKVRLRNEIQHQQGKTSQEQDQSSLHSHATSFLQANMLENMGYYKKEMSNIGNFDGVQPAPKISSSDLSSAAGYPLLGTVFFILNDIGSSLYVVQMKRTKRMADMYEAESVSRTMRRLNVQNVLSLTAYTYMVTAMLTLGCSVIVNTFAVVNPHYTNGAGHVLKILCNNEPACIQHPWQVPHDAYFIIAWVIFVHSITCYILQNWSASKIHASHVSFYTVIQPASAAFLTALWIVLNLDSKHLLALPKSFPMLGMIPIVIALLLILGERSKPSQDLQIWLGKSRIGQCCCPKNQGDTRCYPWSSPDRYGTTPMRLNAAGGGGLNGIESDTGFTASDVSSRQHSYINNLVG